MRNKQTTYFPLRNGINSCITSRSHHAIACVD